MGLDGNYLLYRFLQISQSLSGSLSIPMDDGKLDSRENENTLYCILVHNTKVWQQWQQQHSQHGLI